MSEDLPHIEILARYLNREITEDQLLNESEGLEELVRIAKLSESLEVPNATAMSAAWTKFSSRIAEEEKAKPAVVKSMKRAFPWTRVMSIAAAIGAILIATYLILPKETTIETSYGESNLVSLPDGSEVNIFAASEMSFNKGKWEKSRELDLSGEAYFKVKKGKSFTVHTPNGDVRVLGTSFNVYQRNDNFEVVCFTGKVEVSSNGQKTILTPGEKAILSGSALDKSSLDPSQKEPAWISGKVRFENASLSEISEMFERYYGYKLTFDAEVESKMSGIFLTQDLENAIKVICDPIELNYIFENNRTIHLSR
ncbi:MAG: FecR domain-containing protein [Bacteroidia bacterium]|nr:FecR domain-containing protein [Bacteroidia bacterium]